ncbi:MAG: hypothetical protein COV44_05490 [Deltaproteobacteria bacterium CG11_big_fil_rev_8_21_14_0_20_45_16]|nr:MAG: hypothetical protein COV44_05490 [Deltaproteobacteria bacterium CG11_big_fil_rev_8_21_14_0_20_45_16]
MDKETKVRLLKESIKFVKEHLNQQGPLEYFVHHNPLHSLEYLNFHDAIHEARFLYGSNAYMEIEDYYFIYKQGKITFKDLVHEIKDFFPSLPLQVSRASSITAPILGSCLLSQKQMGSFPKSSQSQFVQKHIEQAMRAQKSQKSSLLTMQVEFRSRLEKRNIHLDEWVAFYLGHILSVYFDSGQAYWPIDYQDTMLKTIKTIFGRKGWFSKPWKKSFQRELMQLDADVNIIEAIIGFLDQLSILPKHYPSFLFDLCYRQKGWSGFVLYLEKFPHLLYSNPKIKSNFQEYLLLLILMEKCLVTHYYGTSQLEIRPKISKRRVSQPKEKAVNYALFLLKNLGLEGLELNEFQKSLLDQVCQMAIHLSLSESRIWQNAFDRRFTNEFVQAVRENTKRETYIQNSPAKVQVVTCIDEREESFRRHLEEVDSGIQTFGYAGNFSLNIKYKGLSDVHFRQLGDLSSQPEYIVEEVCVENNRKPRLTENLLRKFYIAEARLLQRPKDFLFGWLTSLLVGFVVAPHLVLKVYFPYYEDILKKYLNKRFKSQPRNHLVAKKTDENDIDPRDKAEKIEGLLLSMGLHTFSDLIFIVGHGSHSLNNPHEAAHDCGACGGGRGYANARLFALFANDASVRKELANQGFIIPETTTFVAAYHDTCSDEFVIFDENSIPLTSREKLKTLKTLFIEACKRNAHERCRKFSDVSLNITSDDAQRHVIGRANDLSQPRPEYGHATNAICVVGSRTLTQGLFLDRRAFLCSYDFKSDKNSGYLPGLLNTIVTVCSGINLEYYFATVDNQTFGSGTKLPHNVVSLQGVINGTDSDLLLGLPIQMIEIHAPLRLNLLIEAPLSTVEKIVTHHRGSFSRLTNNEWIFTLVFDPEIGQFYKFSKGNFIPMSLRGRPSDCYLSSLHAYRGIRAFSHFVQIESGVQPC